MRGLGFVEVIRKEIPPKHRPETLAERPAVHGEDRDVAADGEADLPSGLRTISPGPEPTGIGANAVLVDKSIGVIAADPLSAT